jgi:hypothetical protein
MEPGKADLHALDDLHGLLEEYGGLSPWLFVPGRDEVTLTESMKTLRAGTLAQRRDTYIQDRLRDQADWFERKAIADRLSEMRNTTTIVAAQIAAVISALVVFLYPGSPITLTGVLTSLAASWTAWQRIRLPSGQSRIYADTARRLNRVTQRAEELSSDAELSAFVRDTEDILIQEVRVWRMRRTYVE